MVISIHCIVIESLHGVVAVFFANTAGQCSSFASTIRQQQIAEMTGQARRHMLLCKSVGGCCATLIRCVHPHCAEQSYNMHSKLLKPVGVATHSSRDANTCCELQVTDRQTPFMQTTEWV